MYLRELKEKYPLVYQRVKEQTHVPSALTYVSADINNTLQWDSTEEGVEFWSLMYYNTAENIRYAKELQPQLFSEDKLPYKVLTNGLFK